MHYNAAIGKSIYQVPYSSDDDLPMLQNLCKRINSIVNLVLATEKTMTNEKALLLALINVSFELQSLKDCKFPENIPEKQYTSKDVLEIISSVHQLINHVAK